MLRGMSLLRTAIGTVLRRLRQRQGRTLQDVADAAGVSLPYLSEIERGRKEASSEVLAAICRALGLELVDLLRLAALELARWRAPRAAGGTAALQPSSRRSAVTAVAHRGDVVLAA